MPSRRISRVELEKFRGATAITAIDFDTSKSIVSIFGDNGCGKSTIVNAIDFVCNKSKGSLESMKSTNHTHIVSIGNKAAELSVKVHRNGNFWHGSQSGREIIVHPEEGMPAAVILRRSKLLRLVEATPSDRFDEIRKFIDFANIETSEQKLRDAVRLSKESLNSKIALHTQAETSLETHWQSEGAHDISAVNWAKLKITQDPSKARASVASLNTVIKSIEDIESKNAEVYSAKTALGSAEQVLAKVNEEIAKAEAGASSANIKLVEMLNSLDLVIADPYDQNECPACESPYDLIKLRVELKKRIELLGAADDLNRQLKQLTGKYDKSLALHDNAFAKLKELANSCVPQFKACLESFSEFSDTLPTLATVTRVGKPEVSERISEFIKLIVATKGRLVAKRGEVQKDITLFDKTKQTYDLVGQTEADVTSEAKILSGLSKSLEIMHEIRIRCTQDILDSVFGEFLRLWELIHPDEPIKPTKLVLNEATKGSLNQLGSFGEHDNISPQAYFSESHLDTLGFCYWLAIAKYSTNGDVIIILDDVFTSVDNDHVSRIMDLLIEESDHFNQIIITTHQRRWHDGFRYGTRSQNKTHVLELGIWDKTNGIVSYPSRMEVERLEDLLSGGPLDRQGVCSKAGVLLEQMFDELTKQYKCSMPRGDRREYTLSDYAGSTKHVFKELNVKSTDTAGIVSDCKMQNFHDELMPFVSVRNQVGAHFNLTATEYPDKELLRFGKLTVDFIKSLLCKSCFGIANKEDRITGEWSCACKQTQMFPKIARKK
ncbi:MAG: AAA family ATPase [Pyrinomonadaceae bacterium]